MTIEDVDILLSTLDDLYPGRFSEFTTAEITLWKKELGTTPLETALAAVRRWYLTKIRQHIPTLISLLTLVDEVRQDDHRELARARQANAAWQALPPGSALAQAAAAYTLGAKDTNTALYGQLMGQLAQHSLGAEGKRRSPDDLVVQCQVWAAAYPQIAAWLQQAARQFAGDGTETLH